jgi:2-oxoglutarate/2-oxoacid ferredoxin oxidoreductase subunit beta
VNGRIVETRQAKDYLSTLKPVWCPGCGDFGVLNALTLAFASLALKPEQFVIVSGIGCSSRMPGYIHGYGFHGIHGRALPVATGLKLVRPDLDVIVTIGDGDAYGIGGNHFLHAARRNVDVTCVVMDNRIYAMTKGQASPTTPLGEVTSTTPEGSVEPPLRPLLLALAAGATFVARACSWEPKRLAALLAQGIRHRGFAAIEVLSPCVTFRPEDRALRERVVWWNRAPTYDLLEAMRTAIEGDELTLGLFYQVERPVFGGEAAVPQKTTCESGRRGLDAVLAARRERRSGPVPQG